MAVYNLLKFRQKRKNWKELFKLQPKWPSYEKRNVMEKPFCHILSKLGPTTSSRVEPINEDNNRIIL
uniref:Uncharacterized protein n=1 Tax=Meloidogyne enterolobii TaxID=390850 RepID=A0A6V7WXL8_MELEN|nr:unnamed protein product [Meloidogyne enterolobii]